MIITIDGPTASGKSTIARTVAHQLSIYYLCSGLLFRSIAYILMRDRHYTITTISNASLADIAAVLDSHLFEYLYQDGRERVVYKGLDITSNLKDSIIDQASSILSTNLHVRTALIAFQRRIAQQKSVVADGRDTGSVVFTDAEYKFFLTASLLVRAARWQKDQAKKGFEFTLEQATEKVNERDMRDMNRAIAPLVIAEGAIVIDSTDLSVDDVVEKIVGYVKK